jgi:hypothetical protein
VPWDELCANPADFERLVKLILQRLYGAGQAIDGSGGDGGREFQVRTLESLTLYEAKSFRGRLGHEHKRRQQVERSLISAARHQPDAWNLVVPIDPSPKEQEWFDGLRAGDFPFVDRWLGVTWLEEQLARHDDLVRLVTENKLLEYARTYKLETEALVGGVDDLLARHEALAALGDTLSPDWRPVVSQPASGVRVVELQAKHPDAGEDAPISFTVTAHIPVDEDTADLREALTISRDLGAGIVDIPGEYLSSLQVSGPAGLGLPGDGAVLQRFVIGEAPETENLPTQHLAVYAPGAALPKASLGFATQSRSRGVAGSRLVAWDSTRTLQLTTDVRWNQAGTFRVQMHPRHPILPSAILPCLRLLHALRAPNAMVLTVGAGDRSMRNEVPIVDGQHSGVSDELLRFVEDLAIIQDRLRQPFPLPETVTGADLRWADQLRRLVEGEAVPWIHGTINVTLDPDKIAGFKAQFPSGGGGLRVSWADQEVCIGEATVHTGPMYMVGVVTIDVDAIPDHPEPGQEVRAAFDLVDDAKFVARLGVPSYEHGTDPATRHRPGMGHVEFNPAVIVDPVASSAPPDQAEKDPTARDPAENAADEADGQ